MLRAAMRLLIVCGLLAAVVAVALVFAWSSGTATPPVPDRDTPPAAAGANAAVTQGPVALPPGTVAQNVDRVAVTADDLADEPTACLLVLDHRDGRAIAGAAVRRVRDGAELAFTDELGRAAVALHDFEQLAVVADGYLLRLAPTRPGSTEQEPQRVQMVADVWSPCVQLRLRTPGGAPVGDAMVRFRAADGTPAPREAAVPVPAGDALLQRAWTEHAMLAGRPVCGDVPVELGVFAPDRVHRLGDGALVRFVVPGSYTMEVATVTGLVARQQVQVQPGSAKSPPQVTVELVTGVEVAGSVRSAGNGAALGEARITVQGSDPLGLVATTAANGSFRLGPLPPGPSTLHVHHGDHEPRAVDVTAPATDVVVALQPLPATVLRGRVRRRPDLVPLADATVAWQPNGSTAAAVRTGADGTFLLRATGTGAARLAIQAPGCRPYAELVTPGTPFADYDVWPGTKSARLAHDLTAVLAGVVLGADGRPQAGVIVRWTPASPTRPPGAPGRRILDGAALDLPLATTSGADGSFTLETDQLGPGRLTAADAADVGAAASASIEVVAEAGKTTHGLRLQR